MIREPTKFREVECLRSGELTARITINSKGFLSHAIAREFIGSDGQVRSTVWLDSRHVAAEAELVDAVKKLYAAVHAGERKYQFGSGPEVETKRGRAAVR